MNKTAVLIPCYNEAPTIAKVVRDFQRALPEATIYVYDNNSTDGTADIASKAGAVVRYVRQQGKGHVVRRMFLEIDAECYIMADGDDTYPADEAPKLLAPILAHEADMVVGDRLSSSYFSENKRLFHGFGNCLVRKSINNLFHTNIMDIMTGYRAFSYDFAKTFPILSNGFEIETEMSIHAADKRLATVSIPVTYKDRAEGSISKLNTYKDGCRVLMTIAKLYCMYKPLPFFSTIAVISGGTAIGFFIPVFHTYITSGLVPNFPTLIVCCFTLVTAIIAFFSGLMLHVLSRKSKQDFEMQLHQVHIQKLLTYQAADLRQTR